MEDCVDCGARLTMRNSMPNGRCSKCHGKHLLQGLDPKLIAREHQKAQAAETSSEHKRRIEREASAERRKARDISLTTETFVGEIDRLGVVATEVVLGMNVFKDMLANIRDIFGGRSGTVQNTLEEARTAAFEDLQLKAMRLGADAIIAIDINYHSISTGSSVNMMMVCVSGTAISWPSASSNDQTITSEA